MWCLKFLVFSFVLTLTCAYNNTTWLPIDEIRYKFLELEDSLWNMTLKGSLTSYKPYSSGELYIVRKIYEIDQKIQQIPSYYSLGVIPLRNLWNFEMFFDNLGIIDLKYAKFSHYLKLRYLQHYDKLLSDEIIYDIFNNDTGLKTAMTTIYEMGYGRQNSMHQHLVKLVDDFYWCRQWVALSPRQSYYNLYNLVSVSGLKAYILEQFAYLISHLEKGGFQQTAVNATKYFLEKTLNIHRQMDKIKLHSNTVLKCDPSTFTKGETYDEFSRLVQGQIVYERSLNSEYSNGDCSKTCDHYKYNVKSSSCRGTIRDCFLISTNIEVCKSDSPRRNYEYIASSNGTIYGQKTFCTEDHKKKLTSEIERLIWRCDYCMCLCVDHPSSDRYISLRSVKSNVQENMVVTGLRFVKQNRVLFLQIEEGKLIPHGRIDQTSVNWKPTDTYNITDPGVRREDYLEMTYDLTNAIALNVATAGKLQNFHVVTGVGFSYINEQIRLRVYITPFEWHTGRLDTNQTREIYKIHQIPKKMPIQKTDEPTRTRPYSMPFHNRGYNYLQFTHTDFRKDAAQSTIPFIDMQPIFSRPAVPIKGAGIYYKGRKGFGGFIAPLIRPYEHLHFLSDKIPSELNRFVNTTVKKAKRYRHLKCQMPNVRNPLC